MEFLAPSFHIMWLLWHAAVLNEIPNVAAISFAVMPSAMSNKTSHLGLVSRSRLAGLSMLAPLLSDIGTLTSEEADAIEPIIAELEVELNRHAHHDEERRTATAEIAS